MTANELGKRFERLLILALPVSVLCVATAFFQQAHFQYSRNSERVVLQKFGAALLGLKVDLDKFFADTKHAKPIPSYLSHTKILEWKDPYQFDFVKDYKSALETMIAASAKRYGSTANQWLSPFKRADLSPEQILSLVNSRAKQIEQIVQLGDVVVPIRPNVSVFGTNVAVPIEAIGAIGYFISCLSLILWYGTMRLTRRREMFALIGTQFRGQPFPHLLNSTMIILASDVRASRGKLAKFNKAVQRIVLACLRSTIFALIAVLTILPLTYTSLVLHFDFEQFEPLAGQFFPFWLLLVTGLVPLIQLTVFWMEEMYWLALTPIRIVVLGRDVLVR
jgi:hypothetical protein